MEKRNIYLLVLIMSFGLLYLYIQKSFMDISVKNVKTYQIESSKSRLKTMMLEYAQTEGIKVSEVNQHLKDKGENLTPEEKNLLLEINKK